MKRAALAAAIALVIATGVIVGVSACVRDVTLRRTPDADIFTDPDGTAAVPDAQIPVDA